MSKRQLPSGAAARFLFSLFLALSVLFLPAFFPGGTALAAEAPRRVFDEAGLFDEGETGELESAIAEFRENWPSSDLAILTVDDAEGKTAAEYADDFYDSREIGSGSQSSGALLSIDMDNREIWLSTLGETAGVLTDSRVEQVLDDAYGPVSEGNYAKGALAAISRIEAYMKAGVPAGQYSSEGEAKTYQARKRSLEWYEIAFALAVSSAAAGAVCLTTANRYKMKEESRQSLNYRMAYRGSSEFHFSKNKANLIGRTVARRAIAGSGMAGPGGAHRSPGNRTTVHRSSSGRMHGGGGRKF